MSVDVPNVKSRFGFRNITAISVVTSFAANYEKVFNITTREQSFTGSIGQINFISYLRDKFHILYGLALLVSFRFVHVAIGADSNVNL